MSTNELLLNTHNVHFHGEIPYLPNVFIQMGLSSVDPNEKLQNAASHQGLPHTQQFLDKTSGSKLSLFKF